MKIFSPRHSAKLTLFLLFCSNISTQNFEYFENDELTNPEFEYKDYIAANSDILISRKQYFDQLYGFWLGQCIGNWTGLVTEMDKIGNIGEIKTGAFYTRDDWGKSDQPNIWDNGKISKISNTIDFVFAGEDSIWGSDDDTDIEYIYQHILYEKKKSVLNGEDIRDGWINHIKQNGENFLWVSNQKAFDLMLKGKIPPNTSSSENNEHNEMIDAQLTTEIFGLFSPTRPDFALKMSKLPIRTTARYNAEWAAEFYVIMHSLASYPIHEMNQKKKIIWMANKARERLPSNSYPAKMYDFIKNSYESNIPWEKARDMVYEKYQINQDDGYDITSRNLYCNGCFASGINFAASIISLLYGEGNFKNTIKIATLCGWDSDNPSATWGGLIGFMIGKKGIEKSFGRKFSDRFNIHRTRKGFPNDGVDNFFNMSAKGLFILDRIVQDDLGGGIDLEKNIWYIPKFSINISEGSVD